MPPAAKKEKAATTKFVTTQESSPFLQPTQLTGYKHSYTRVQEGKITFVEVATMGGPRDFMAIPMEYIPSFMKELEQAYQFFKKQK